LKDVISTPRSPKAIGPYSQAIKANGFIIISGQLPIDPVSGQLVEGDIALQAEVALENLRAIVVAAGSSLAKAVKTTVYLKDLNDFTKVNPNLWEVFLFGSAGTFDGRGSRITKGSVR
jgi:2-iminobutanoate/2-iminopropanoate deaminase